MSRPPAPLRHLPQRRRLARLALGWELLWPALWPPLGVLGLFLLLALLGLPLLLPPWARGLLALGFLAGIGFATWRGFRGLHVPGRDEADRRLEAASGLSHRPLAALADRPAGHDPMALALWEAHRRRATASIRALRVGLPRPGLARRDPIALRAALGLSLFAALVAAGGEAPERLRLALVPQFGLAAAAPALRLEAWVTPPAYTGAAPIFLDAAGGSLTVPQGSRLQVALSGGSGGTPDLQLGASATPFRALDARSWAAEAVLEQGARLAIRRDGFEVAGWTLTVQADQPPIAEFTEPPARAARGLALRLPWRVEDDWGVLALAAAMQLVARPEAPPHPIEMTLPAMQPRQASGTAGPDLSAHPWAGLEVRLQLIARDGAGQEGRSQAATLLLPERGFTHPVAQALIAQRKALSLDPEARAPVWAALDALAEAPDAFEHDTITFLALRSARHRLELDSRPEAVPEVQETLWETALALEEGRADRTARALEQARADLREALEQAMRDQQERAQNPEATPERQESERTETERRIDELREAIRRHLEAMAERLQQENAESMTTDPQNRLMDRRDLDRRTERMREANREDRPQDAERELAELEEMLRALQEGRSARSEAADRQRQQRQRGQQQMGVVQDMVQRQTRMLDSGHRRAEAEAERQEADRRAQQLQNRAPWSRPNPAQDAQRQQQRDAAEAAARSESEREARTQRALRRALGEVMQQFGDLTGEIPAPLGRADQAMREAQEALSQGGDARTPQQTAIRELQEGGRQMAQQMQRQFGPGDQGDEQGEGPGQMMGEGTGQGDGNDQAQQQGQGRDPLGRATREVPGAQDNGSDTRVPDEAELLRTRRIQEELRKRGAERTRPQEELDYIDRLLKRF
ncbi:TIGR02302 family protein [Falsiroseomonas selenitidurans]|uniref:TIGR02302 family protein n=1 Tax=Falsiroseomonas selenitidurans TaxID=2716335 RepID=A0ABX1EDV7_9PROT|nr:TIGR02302 family protein [Falsiroseomonas selenitidurans]NKC33938.1 TIGR02302 family protein [Falsiroseomonas selenitidurans]